jgi:hypothetical protein
MRSHLLVACAALGALGCGAQEPKFASVSGKVTLDGEPLPNALVTFQPVAQKKGVNPGPASTGRTNAKGEYTLQVVGRPETGALVGKHRVLITAYKGEVPAATDDAKPEMPPQLVPERYNAATTLTVEVPAEGTEKANFDLTTKEDAEGQADD